MKDAVKLVLPTPSNWLYLRHQTGLHIQIWAIDIIHKEHIRRNMRLFYSVKVYNSLMEGEKTEFYTVVSELRQNLTETLKELDKLDRLLLFLVSILIFTA